MRISLGVGFNRAQTSFGCAKCDKVVEKLVDAGADALKAKKYAQLLAPPGGDKRLINPRKSVHFPHARLAKSLFSDVLYNAKERAGQINKILKA